MKKIIVWFVTLLFFVSFAAYAIKVNAEEVIENDVVENEIVEEEQEEENVENDEPIVEETTPEVDNTPTTDDNTQEEVDKVPTVIEEKAKEITDYIIAAVVAFLGSSTFYAIVKALTSKAVKALSEKVKQLEEENKISKEAKELYEKKIKELETQLVNATYKMDEVLEKITNILEIDEQKQKQMAELLEKLLPPVDDIKEGE